MITIPLAVWYSACHIILWPTDMRAALKAAHFDDDDIESIMDDHFEALTMLNSRNEPVIVIAERSSGAKLAGVLAHEALHASVALLDVCGVKVRAGKRNESHAYMIGYIVEEGLRQIDALPDSRRTKDMRLLREMITILHQTPPESFSESNRVKRQQVIDEIEAS